MPPTTKKTNFSIPSLNALTGKTPTYTPSEKAPTQSIAPASSSVPVADVSQKKPTQPPVTPAPIKSNLATSLDGIKSKALEIQALLDAKKAKEGKEATAATNSAEPQELGDTPEMSQRDQVLQQYMDINSTDLADDKQAVRDEAQVDSKREYAQKLYNEMLQSEQDFKARRAAIEKNPDGKLRGALNAELNDLEVEFSRKRANDAITYNIALGDYQSAEKIVQDRISDMEADITRQSNMLAQVYQFMGDDLTDSERVQIDQNFQEYMADKGQTFKKELWELEAPMREAQMQNIYSQISDRRSRLQLAQQAASLSISNARLAEMKAAGEQAEIDEAKGEKALGMLMSIKELKKHEGLQAAVGPNPLARVEYGLGTGILKGLFTGNKSDFRSEVDMLANTLTLENMDLLKGPATDKDVEIVAASMSKLKNYDVSEASYWEEFNRLEAAAQRIVDKVGVTPEQAQFYFGTDDTDMALVDEIYGGSDTGQSTALYNNW